MKINIQDSSTKQSPLAYFEYLYTRNGIKELHEWFLCTYSHYYENGLIDYNPKTDTIERWENESPNGELVDYSIHFKDIFLDKAKEQFRISRKLINNRVEELLNREEKIQLLINIYDTLIWLLKVIRCDAHLNKYLFIGIPINKLLYFLNERYSYYLPKNLNKTLTEFDHILKQNIYDKPKKPVKENLKTFEWNKKPETLVLLHSELIRLKFIHNDTDLIIFQSAFTCSNDEPLSKIQFLPRGNNGYGNNKLLFYLLNKLIDNKCLAPIPEKVPLNKITGLIFYDFEKKDFKSLKSTQSAAKKIPMPEKLPPIGYNNVDELIKLIIKTDDLT